MNEFHPLGIEAVRWRAAARGRNGPVFRPSARGTHSQKKLPREAAALATAEVVGVMKTAALHAKMKSRDGVASPQALEQAAT